MVKDVLLIAHFTQILGEKGNGRFHYVAERLAEAGLCVEVVTSDFSHGGKYCRKVLKEQVASLSYRLTLLHEPGYKENVSLRRLWSHFLFGRSLDAYLRQRRAPDVVYCAVPSLDAADVAAKYARRHDIRFIIDIQDLWPEAFEMLLPVPRLGSLFFGPLKARAESVYAAADEIVAVSQTYADRALQVNRKCAAAHSVYLGTDLITFDRLAREQEYPQKPKDEIWIAYVGTLGHSYDLTCVISAIRLLEGRGVRGLKLLVMGDGPLKSQFMVCAQRAGVHAEFTGRLEYGEMVGHLTACDIAVNPIRRGSAASIINKHADYAAAGLPVVNTQESLEYQALIDLYGCGINCEASDHVALADALERLVLDAQLRVGMAKQSRRLAEDMFNRATSYRKILNLVLR